MLRQSYAISMPRHLAEVESEIVTISACSWALGTLFSSRSLSKVQQHVSALQVAGWCPLFFRAGQ